MRVSPRFLAMVDGERRRDEKLPSRAEMIRILCEEAISRRKASKRKEG